MVVTSVGEGAILGGLDREEATLDRFFAWLGKRRCPAIQVFCSEIWAPSLAAIRI